MMADRTTSPPSGERRALHLAVSDFCNNSCLFCLNSRVDGRLGQAPATPPSWAQIQSALEEGYREVGLREVIFTIAEPTLGKHLVEAVRLAAELGYERIAMNTNGRRLAEGDFVARLLDAGMNAIMLSVHGPTAEIHDRLVGRAGAFEQVVAGLTKLRAHRPARGFVLQMLCVLCRVNLPHVEGMYRFFLRHARPERGDHISFTCLKMLGLGAARFAELGVRYAPLAREWIRVWRSLGSPREMRLSEIPWCAVVAVADDGLPIPPLDIPDRRFVTEDPPERAAASGAAPEHEPAAGGQPIERNAPATRAPSVVAPTLRGTDYVQRPACALCLLQPSCSGVLRGYAERFGWDELPPVRTLPTGAADAGRLAGGRDGAASTHRLRVLNPASRELIGDLLGMDEDGWETIGLEPAGLGEERGELWFSLRGAVQERSDFGLTIYVGEPDPDRPAFARTAELRIYYQASGQPKLATRLMRRLARVLGTAKLADLRRAWRRATGAMPDAGERSLSATGDRTAPMFGDAALAARLGDSACGMMGAVEILRELPDRLAILVHGDRGCLPTPESPSPGLYSTDLTDMDLVHGAEQRAIDAARLIVQGGAPRAIVLVGTCLSKMIGEDLLEVARDIEQRHAVPTVALEVSGLERLRPYETTDRIYAALGRRFLQREPQPGRRGGDAVGLVGYPSRGGSFEAELGELARGAGVALGARWPQGGLDALGRLGGASVVLAPERIACRALLAELAERHDVRVVEQPTPIGLELTRAFFRALARAADESARAGARTTASSDGAPTAPSEAHAARMDQLIAPRVDALGARIERFRSRHAGQRVLCVFGGTHKGASLDACTHLALAHVPLLVELGMVAELAALTPDASPPDDALAALATRLGASPTVRVYPRPELLPELLVGLRPALVVVEDCHKHYVDAAAMSYFGFRQFELGFTGLERAIDALELVLP